MILICLSVCPHGNIRKYSSIVTKLTYVNRCHSSMLIPIENRMCSSYTFFYRHSKETQYLTVNGRYWLEVNLYKYIFNITKFFYVIKIHLKCFSIEKGIGSCYIFLQGRTKEIRHFTLKGRFLLEMNFSNVNISLT